MFHDHNATLVKVARSVLAASGCASALLATFVLRCDYVQPIKFQDITVDSIGIKRNGKITIMTKWDALGYNKNQTIFGLNRFDKM